MQFFPRQKFVGRPKLTPPKVGRRPISDKIFKVGATGWGLCFSCYCSVGLFN